MNLPQIAITQKTHYQCFRLQGDLAKQEQRDELLAIAQFAEKISSNSISPDDIRKELFSALPKVVSERLYAIAVHEGILDEHGALTDEGRKVIDDKKAFVARHGEFELNVAIRSEMVKALELDVYSVTAASAATRDVSSTEATTTIKPFERQLGKQTRVAVSSGEKWQFQNMQPIVQEVAGAEISGRITLSYVDGEATNCTINLLSEETKDKPPLVKNVSNDQKKAALAKKLIDQLEDELLKTEGIGLEFRSEEGLDEDATASVFLIDSDGMYWQQFLRDQPAFLASRKFNLGFPVNMEDLGGSEVDVKIVNAPIRPLDARSAAEWVKELVLGEIADYQFFDNYRTLCARHIDAFPEFDHIDVPDQQALASALTSKTSLRRTWWLQAPLDWELV